MQHFSISPHALVGSLWRHRALTKSLIVREVIGRYQGSMLGLLWSFCHPLLMLMVYTFVFSVVFNARWPGVGSDSKVEFALVLFAGLMVFNLFAECVSRAPGLILGNANYVKKIIFPLEILPCVALGASFFHSFVSLGVWFLCYCLFIGLPPLTALWLPIILLPLVLLTLGLSWLLASLGVYLRDVNQIIGVIVTTLMFLSPIFYSASALPVDYQPLLQLNPLTTVIEQVRGVLLWGKLPDWGIYIQYLAGSILMAWLGFAWFQKTRKGFADVI